MQWETLASAWSLLLAVLQILEIWWLKFNWLSNVTPRSFSNLVLEILFSLIFASKLSFLLKSRWHLNLAGRWVTIVSDHVVFRHPVTNWTNYISNTTVPMATKLGRIVTYLGWLLPIMLPIPLVTWACKITWQTKTAISPIPQYPWSSNVAGWLLTMRCSHP